MRLTSSARAPFVRRELGKPRRVRERGVVDEDVDAPKALKCQPHDLLRHSRRGDVTRHGERAIAERGGEILGACDVAHVHGDRGAAFVEALRRGASEPAPAPVTITTRPAKSGAGGWSLISISTLPVAVPIRTGTRELWLALFRIRPQW